MNDHIGMTTRDLRTLGLANPAEQGLTPEERETRTRRYGRTCRRTGLSIIATVFATALIAAKLAEERVFNAPAAQALANLALFAALITGSILTSAGFSERRERPLRAKMRQTLADGHARDQRLDRIEAALTEIGERLPGALEREHWKGFNAAVREGFMPTGTCEPGRTSTGGARLGLVPPKNP